MGTIGIIVGAVILLIIICMGYVKAPPDQAYIISGLRKTCASSYWPCKCESSFFGTVG